MLQISRLFCSSRPNSIASSLLTVSDLLKISSPKDGVAVQGWVWSVNKLGKQQFVRLNDGTNFNVVQLVIPKGVCSKISVGSAMKVAGDWVVSRGADQPMELVVSRCDILGQNELQTITKDVSKDPDLLRQQLHLRAKSPHYAALLRLRSRLTAITHKYFQERSFVHYDPPIISLNDCEGAGETFEIKGSVDEDFFGENLTSYLTVSSQLFLEAAASALPKVYTIGSTFRADKSTTSQHLSEFKMLEVECAFERSLDGICSLLEDYLEFVINDIAQYRKDIDGCAPFRKNDEPSTYSQFFQPLIDGKIRRPFPRIEYSEVVEVLQRLNPADPIDASKGLSKKQEFELIRELGQGGPLFILRYPSSQKPFYMRRTGDFAECFDLLAPFVGELAGGSVREWDSELLASRIGATPKLAWYLDLRRHGYPGSSGFGLGIERLMQTIFGIANVRDTIPFPRWYKHCKY